MRHLFALTASVLLLGAAPPANYNAFGVAVLQRLAAHSGNNNVFISPLSLGIALAMAAEGARGATRTEMLHVLGASADTLTEGNEALIRALQGNHDAQLGIADALWTRQDVQPNASYVSLLRDAYDARVQALHFGDPSAAATINAWTKEHTLGLIPELVPATEEQDFLYLTNALAFMGDWTTPFEPRVTHAAPFTNAAGVTRDVPMMSRSGSFDVATEPTYRVLRLPYGNGGYAAYILLPTKGSAAALAQTLTAPSLDAALRSAAPEYIDVQLPRFTASYSAELSDVLGGLGMSGAFAHSADFSGIHASPPALWIGKVIHESYLHVYEKGTTAAAATSVTITTAAIMDMQHFIVDRPFVFAIREEHTGALLFLGVINSVSS